MSVGECLEGECLAALALCIGDNCRPCELAMLMVSNGVPGVECDDVVACKDDVEARDDACVGDTFSCAWDDDDEL